MPLGTEVGFGPGDIVLDGDPALPLKRGTSPTFGPISIVAKRLPISSTVEHLLRFGCKVCKVRARDRLVLG